MRTGQNQYTQQSLSSRLENKIRVILSNINSFWTKKYSTFQKQKKGKVLVGWVSGKQQVWGKSDPWCCLLHALSKVLAIWDSWCSRRVWCTICRAATCAQAWNPKKKKKVQPRGWWDSTQVKCLPYKEPTWVQFPIPHMVL